MRKGENKRLRKRANEKKINRERRKKIIFLPIYLAPKILIRFHK